MNAHRRPKPTRHIGGRFISALFAAALGSCALISTPINAGEKNMTELTKNMQPVCVGRFVFEIPKVARINGWGQNVDDTKIEMIVPPSANKSIFDATIAQRVTLLKTSPSKTDGYIFKDKTQLTPDSYLLASYVNVSRYKSDGFLYKLDAFFWRPTLEVRFHTGTTDEYLETGIARILR